MKYFTVAVSALTLAAAAAPPPPPQPELRQALQQYHPGATPAPRELTPVQRAELRRQVSEATASPRRR